MPHYQNGKDSKEEEKPNKCSFVRAKLTFASFFLLLWNLSLCEIPLSMAGWQHKFLDAQYDKKGILTLLPEPRMINSVPLVSD